MNLPPITDDGIQAFLADFFWMRKSKVFRERMAYSIVVRLVEDKARLRMELAALRGEQEKGKWEQQIEKRRKK